jgi:hypothetical protein
LVLAIRFRISDFGFVLLLENPRKIEDEKEEEDQKEAFN